MCRDFDKFTFSRGLSADDPYLLLCRQTVTSSVVKLVSCVNTSHARVIGEKASLVCYIEVIDLAPCLINKWFHQLVLVEITCLA